MLLVSGFTFIKNGLSLGYPIKESIESITPLCDEVVINVGFDDPQLQKDDGTWDYLHSYFNHPKFIFLKSFWDPKVTSGGEILAQQTNIALAKCQGRVCQYIQGDEVIHEDDLPEIHDQLIDLSQSKTIDGLVFNYHHFYGNVDIVKKTRSIYRREIRAIANHRGIKSWKDAQGFRLSDNQKLKAKAIDARIFHYGWARLEKVMQHKVSVMDRFYHGQDYQGAGFNYERVWGLKPFKSGHPQVMKEWIEKNKNPIDIMQLPLRHEWKNVGLALADMVEGVTNYRPFEYKNFRLI